MDKVSVLKWVRDINGWSKAITQNGTWWAHDEGHWRLAGGQWSGQVSDGNLSTAQDVWETDYIARCSEFLRAAGPGQVVVQAEDLTRIVTWFRGDARTVPHADMDATLGRFKAAIDAAGGEK